VLEWGGLVFQVLKKLFPIPQELFVIACAALDLLDDGML
jgi:hypothetical protein